MQTGKQKTNRGVTFIELMIAILILSIVVGAAMRAYQYHIQLSETAKETAQAVNDSRDIMERIACAPFNQIETDFPDGIADGTATNDYEAIVGGYLLNSEHITVSYPSPGTDPLEIVISVTWIGPRARPLALSLSTFKGE